MSAPLLQVEGLAREYPAPRAGLFAPHRSVRVLHGVDLTIRQGESLGVVGESGCGKSTLARAVMALEAPQAGRVLIRGRDLFALSPAELRVARRDFQAVLQDPYGSLDPRWSVERIVAEPIVSLERVDAAPRRARVMQALAQVGLPESAAEKYPHEFSGGQRQRVAIARALVTRPALIVADEPVSALDVSVQAQVLNLMIELQETLGLAYLFISHDLAVVRAIADRVAVMVLGRIVEEGDTQAVFDDPRHPYARALIAAAPKLGADRPRLDAPSTPARPPAAGCPYAPRCPLAQDVCRAARPDLRPARHGGRAACHFA
jgi:peptide/nickel transport system ATP-binding protein